MKTSGTLSPAPQESSGADSHLLRVNEHLHSAAPGEDQLPPPSGQTDAAKRNWAESLCAATK